MRPRSVPMAAASPMGAAPHATALGFILLETRNSGIRGSWVRGECNLSIAQVIMIIYMVKNTRLS